MPSPTEFDGSVEPAAPEVTDEVLLHRVRDGDEGSLRTLIRRHESRMYALALSMTRNTFDAEDVVGVGFLEFWRRRDAVRLVDGSALPWLLKVVTFAAKNQLRGQRRYARLLEHLPRSIEVPDHAEELAAHADAGVITRDIEAALRSASAKNAAVIALCVVQEMPLRDAALVLGISEATVRTRLSRAKASLRIALAHHAPRVAEDRS